uniref:Uncharacterized protein n=1 Tax=Arundo donax TaxID=35708 RepID=A0A0A8YM89_ARUDO
MKLASCQNTKSKYNHTRFNYELFKHLNLRRLSKDGTKQALYMQN